MTSAPARTRPPGMLLECEAPPRWWDDLDPGAALDELDELTARAAAGDLRLVLDARRLQAHASAARTAAPERMDSLMLAEFDSLFRQWLDQGVEGVRVHHPSREVALRIGVNGRHRSVEFDGVGTRWSAADLGAAIDRRLRNGDVEATGFWSICPPPGGGAACPYHGGRRERAALLLAMALPGSAYLENGRYRLIDPAWNRPGRLTGCELCELAERRVYAEPLVELYRSAMRTRSTHVAFAAADCQLAAAPDGVIAVERGNRLRAVLNLSEKAVPAPGAVVLASEPVLAGELAPGACAWLAV